MNKHKRRLLFWRDTESFNIDGSEVSEEVEKALKPIYKKWTGKGCGIRDITTIVDATVSCMSSEMLIIKGLKIRKRGMDKQE